MIAIAPTVTSVEGPPGSRRQFTLTVTNTGAEPLTCEMLNHSLALTEGGMPYGTREQTPRSAADWIAFQPQEFALQRGETQEVTCTVSLRPATPGGYYAVVAAHGRSQVPPAAPQAGKAVVRFSFQANCVVMVVLRGGRPTLELESRGVELVPVQGASAPRWRVCARVENVGRTHGWAEGTAELKDRLGVVVWRGPILSGRGLLIPGFVRAFQSQEPIALTPGEYVLGFDIRAPGSRAGVRGAQTFRVSGRQVEHLSDGGTSWARTSDLAVSPGEVCLRGPVGSRRTASVLVMNEGETSGRWEVRTTKWTPEATGDSPAESLDEEGPTWLAVEPRSFDLRPRTRTRLLVTANIPSELDGEQYATVLLAPTHEDTAHRLPAGLAVVVASQGTERPALAIPTLDVRPSPKAGYLLSATLCNEGNVRMWPSLRMWVTDAKGRHTGEALRPALEADALYPDATTSVEVEWPRALASGSYVLWAEARSRSGEVVATEKHGFQVRSQ